MSSVGQTDTRDATAGPGQTLMCWLHTVLRGISLPLGRTWAKGQEERAFGGSDS